MGGTGSGRRPAKPRPRSAAAAVHDRELVKPSGLDARAGEFWDRVTHLCRGYLVAADGPWLDATCRAWSMMLADLDGVRQFPEDRDVRRSCNESIRIWADLATELGLNPRSRQKLVAPPGASEDPFEQFLGVIG